MVIDASRLLFVVGPARSGTTYTMAQLNRSDQLFLFSELNSYRLGAYGTPPKSQPGNRFAEAFNQRKAAEGNTRQKGSFIPNPDRYHTVEQLFSELSAGYRMVGEKVALSGLPDSGRYPAEQLFDFHVENYFHAYHLLVLRRPSEALESMLLMFPQVPVRTQLTGLLIAFERLFELGWILPRARVAFYERLGEDAFRTVFEWLGLQWDPQTFLPFSSRLRPDWELRRAELFRQMPELARLESIYEEFLRETDPSPFWLRSEERSFRCGRIYDRIASALRVLVEDFHAGNPADVSPAPSSKGPSSTGVRVVLETLHPLAADSVDHRYPLGTKHDNYRSAPFTQKLLQLYAHRPLAVLDLGCAGGGFVKEIAEAGHLSVGLEGSDYSRRTNRAEWATIPDRLFTCDCAQPFSLFLEEDGGRRPAVFHVITAWELLEHIPETQLPTLLENVRHHLHPVEGLFIASVHLRACVVDGIEYHATVRPEWWWRSLFLDHGFYPVDRALDYFGDDWVRGPSVEQNALGSFHVVLTLAPAGPMVRRIDRVAGEGLDHAHVGQGELRRILAEYRRQLEESRQQVENLQFLNRLFAERSAYTWPNLCRAAAHAIERCREQGYRSVAFYGVGEHTSRLLPVWEGLGGPPVVALLVSENPGGPRFGRSVVAAGGPIPPEVQAVVPSSHTHEPAMRRNWLSLHPEVPWVPLWESDHPASERPPYHD